MATAGTEGLPSPQRVLILDDDAAVGMLFEMVARTAGADTCLTLKAAAFFTALDAWHPTHLVIDLRMPEMSGRAVLAELTRLRCTARIIIASGDAGDLEEVQRDYAAALDIRGILPKPFTAASLRALLDR